MDFLKNLAMNNKRGIATVAGIGLAWAQSRGWVDANTAKTLTEALTAFGAVAIGHAVYKAKA